MCEYCLQTNCPPRCPNYEPVAVHWCEHCKEAIEKGEDFYRLNDSIFCSECVEELGAEELLEFLGIYKEEAE